MLKKILIENFQKHKNLKIQFSPKITTIIGASDKGKSAVLRAIRWVVFNRPLGQDFITEGESEARVVLNTNVCAVERKRGSQENSYVLNSARFQAFGNDPPDEIINTINMGAVNFQDQHDPPFWLSESPGEVSKNLNKIVNLSLIDSTQTNLGKIGRSTKAELKVVQKRLENLRVDHEKYKVVSEINMELEHIEKLKSIYDQISEKIRVLNGLKEDWENNQGTIGVLDEAITKSLVQLTVIDNLAKQTTQYENKIIRLCGLVSDHKSQNKIIREQESKIFNWQKEIKDLMGDRCLLCNQVIEK